MLTEDAVKELEAKHGELLVCRAKMREGDQQPRWTIALRKPKRANYKMYRAGEKKGDPDAQENLVIGICVYPERPELLELLERYPAIPEAITEPLKRWLDLDWEEEGKG